LKIQIVAEQSPLNKLTVIKFLKLTICFLQLESHP